MPRCNVCVDAGVCKMRTLITAVPDDMGMVKIAIKSDCPNILKMSWKIDSFSPYAEVEADFFKSEVYALANDVIPHTACPVPTAIIKAIEVAGDLGLKRGVTIDFVDDDFEL